MPRGRAPTARRSFRNGSDSASKLRAAPHRAADAGRGGRFLGFDQGGLLLVGHAANVQAPIADLLARAAGP